MTGILTAKEGHFTTLRRPDGFLLAAVNYSKGLAGFYVTMFWPPGAYDGDIYAREEDAVASAIGLQDGKVAA